MPSDRLRWFFAGLRLEDQPTPAKEYGIDREKHLVWYNRGEAVPLVMLLVAFVGVPLVIGIAAGWAYVSAQSPAMIAIAGGVMFCAGYVLAAITRKRLFWVAIAALACIVMAAGSYRFIWPKMDDWRYRMQLSERKIETMCDHVFGQPPAGKEPCFPNETKKVP